MSLQESKHYQRIPEKGCITDWRDLQRYYTKHECSDTNTRWIFRGQRSDENDRQLETGFERLLRIIPKNRIAAAKSECKKNQAWDNEWLEFGLLRMFQRQYHHYTSDVPRKGDIIEWFSLMQHYGVPTRLLDWTYSFYVAIFFAVENVKVIEEAQVWAINADWINDRVLGMEGILEKKDRNFQRFSHFKKLNKQDLVITVNPYRLNERLTLQQGVFLMPGNVNKTFEENLLALQERDGDLKNNLLKFVIGTERHGRSDILHNLIRMNMSRKTLFPGLDGFADSLTVTAFTMPETLVPDAIYYSL